VWQDPGVCAQKVAQQHNTCLDAGQQRLRFQTSFLAHGPLSESRNTMHSGRLLMPLQNSFIAHGPTA